MTDNFKEYIRLRKRYNATDTYPTNVKVHNLCDPDTHIPQTLIQSLGLGLKFCIGYNPVTSNIDHKRFQRDIRLRQYFASSPEVTTQDYNPKLYVKSIWEPDAQCEHVELALETFKDELEKLFAQHRTKPYEANLTQSEIQTLKQIKKEKRLIILNTDKNLGPAIMETTKYYQRAFQDHLSNQTNYKEISATDANQYSYIAFLKI